MLVENWLVNTMANQRMYAAFGTYCVVSGPMLFGWLVVAKRWVWLDGATQDWIKSLEAYGVLVGTNVVMKELPEIKYVHDEIQITVK